MSRGARQRATLLFGVLGTLQVEERSEMEAKIATGERDWITVKQAADELGKVPTHVYRLAQQGRVGFQHEPFGVMRVRRADVERIKTERQPEKAAS